MSALMVRAYCDRVIKLSSVLPGYAPEKEVICNVHGIRQEFLDAAPPKASKAYFLGKLLWAKGLDRMLELQRAFRKRTGDYFELDVYGSGPDEKDIQKTYLGGIDAYSHDETSQPLSVSSGSHCSNQGDNTDKNIHIPASSSIRTSTPLAVHWSNASRRLRGQPLPVRFLGRMDHASLSSEYKIFCNPSVSEVLCTSTAEALAMGKFVIIPNHPSNAFFMDFPNCLVYDTKEDFCSLLQYAKQHDAEPLSDHLKYQLTWEAATERFLDAAEISGRDSARGDRIMSRKWDERIAQFHYELGKGRTGDVIRKVLGGGPVADQHEYETMCNTAAASTTVVQG